MNTGDDSVIAPPADAGSDGKQLAATAGGGEGLVTPPRVPYSVENEMSGLVTLDARIFGGPVGRALLPAYMQQRAQERAELRAEVKTLRDERDSDRQELATLRAEKKGARRTALLQKLMALLGAGLMTNSRYIYVESNDTYVAGITLVIGLILAVVAITGLPDWSRK